MCVCVWGERKERKTVFVRQLTASQVPERMRWASEHTSTELSFSLSFFTLTNHTHELWLIQSQPPHLPAASFSKSLSPHSLFSKTSSLICTFPFQHTIPQLFSLLILLWSFVFPYLLHVFNHSSSPVLDLSLHQQTPDFWLFLFLQGRTTVRKNYRDTKSNPINGKRDDCSSILTNILKYTNILILADTTSW